MNRDLRNPKQETALFLLPNLFTTGNLFFGCLAIYMLLQLNVHMASLCIIVAAIFDLFDGRIARMAGTSTVFGTEYDSLCDLVSFGIAPALLMYHWGFHDFGRLGWSFVFLFIVCVALRLARFNTESKNAMTEKAYFKGLPCPAAAGFFSTMVLFFRDLDLAPLGRPWLMFALLSVALLMVSPIPFRSFKDFRLFSNNLFTQLVLLVFIVLVILIRWEVNLFIVASVYILANLIMYTLHLLRGLNKRGKRASHRETRL